MYLIRSKSLGLYFLGVRGSMAIGTASASAARTFKSAKAALTLLNKWKGTGVGIEMFNEIVLA